MNQLSLARRVQITKCLVEGNSLRSTSRLCGAAINTVMNFAKDLGETCEKYQREVFKNLECKRIQCDEIWSFVGRKEKRVTPELKEIGEGDAWTWVAIDADTRLVPSWHVGLRDAESAKVFMTDLASRLKNRVQLSTDGFKSYLTAVEDVFGTEIDYGMLVKIYGDSPHDKRIGVVTAIGETQIGKPDHSHIKTSYNERQNLTMRMCIRRFTRKTNAYSKKIHHHKCAIALHYMHYNFVRVHGTLKTTPAMKAKVTDHVWTLEEMVALMA